jgi:hypothetical protein
MAGYKAGYKAAFEWVSVDDGLPDNGRAILAFNEVCRAVWVSNRVEDGGVIPLNPPFWGEFKATHWREIEMRAIVD